MRVVVISTSILIPIVLLGCANLSPDQKTELDHLPPPTGYQEKTKAIVDPELRDPYTAHYRFTEPRKAYFTNGFDVSKGLGVAGVGYLEIVYVNAKNGFGGYTGEQPMYFTISESGKIEECTADLVRMTVHIAK